MKKAVRARKAATKTATAVGSRVGGEAFQRGLEALRQYIAREGGLPGRAVVERLPGGDVRRVGVWLANQKQRRDRLDRAQLAALAELGADRAPAPRSLGGRGLLSVGGDGGFGRSRPAGGHGGGGAGAGRHRGDPQPGRGRGRRGGQHS
ncbi:helicase associated domain-containing protein [Streptomyces sp. NPDC056400]|uniref:helicase associated domain-containing protein n=1 Tax=Streptomyces sp. NPDC056400 TaxID=3345808 RepID=UPI0035E2ED92